MSHADTVRPCAPLRALFAVPVAAFETRAPGTLESLYPEEAEHIVRAVPKRVGEFAAGRACARAALAQLGINGAALRVGPERDPLWPAEVVGSITHADGYCAAVLARRGSARALGIDVERVNAVRSELWRHIATVEERDWLSQLSPAQAAHMGTLLFSAKEAFFKCQHPLTREWLNFADVHIGFAADGFRVEPSRTLRLEAFAPAPWEGRFTTLEGLIATGIALPS
jgi:4'-phosphopantetheinyl transferase EntD